MIAEHQFVTTMEEDEAMGKAAELLRGFGFRVTINPDGLSATGGKKNPGQAKRYDQLPQLINMTFDRGRCVAAASITPLRKPDHLHEQIVKTRLSALEYVLVHGHTADTVREQLWIKLQGKIESKAQQRKMRQRILVGVLIAIVTLIIALIVYAATM